MTHDLEELRRLADAATPGPWEDGGPSPSVTVIFMADPGCTHPEYAEPPHYEAVAYLHDGSATDYQGERPQQALADARFIAAARTAIPELLDALAAAPAWHKRPTCPGLHLCFDEHGMSYQQNIDDVDAFNATYEGSCVYGPIPSPPQETTT